MSVKFSLLALIALLAVAIFQQRTHRPPPPVSDAAALRGAIWVAPGEDLAKSTPSSE